VRVAEALEQLPRMRELLEVGGISYSAVREITRVATSENEAQWIEWAEGQAIGEIERMVSGRRAGDVPELPRQPQLEKRRWGADLEPDVYAAVIEARRQIEEECGGTLDDSAFVAALCERAFAGRGADDCDDARAPYQIAITVCEQCQRATQDGGGEVIDVAPAVLERARCDADEIHIGCEGGKLESAIPPRIRRDVLRRDHRRCAVPGCRGAKWIEIHHIVPREAGGTHDLGNLISLCGPHHRARHDGRLVIRGVAPGRLVFEQRDGSRYGGQFFEQVKAAIRTSGYKARIADAAVERVSARLGTAVRLEEAIAAAFVECGRMGRGAE
jgi:hypothetical protein